jgi:hypothetical protein
MNVAYIMHLNAKTAHIFKIEHKVVQPKGNLTLKQGIKNLENQIE